jgi:hypothetical protein
MRCIKSFALESLSHPPPKSTDLLAPRTLRFATV